ncbi:MAG: beta-N-acetylhexosaminidase [Micrococcaceae bacterium]|jgi:beta-N-acetylhexosaminidase|nr:beta-N-acetylhexosaminidase [Micrococcaceae bacterium]
MQVSTSASDAAAASPLDSTASPPVFVPPPPVLSPAERVLAGMTLEQKLGQLLMVGSPVTGADANTLAVLSEHHVGNSFLKGRGYGGTAAVGAVVGQLAALATAESTAGVRPFVATDQEGGLVQIMNGPGFSPIPSALQQGSWAPGQVEASARQWGSELAAAGINVNFAPVLDTVPDPSFAAANAPIGRFQREYGFTPETVAAAGTAFAQGMASAGVAPVVKHFPGLGRVTANTDTTSGVTDTQTTRSDPYLVPFRAALQSGVQWLMVSNAYYAAIDPTQMAPFSPVILRDMVRGDLGFQGVIVSDDICDAVQLSPVPPADRAAGFIAAGGSVALCTNAALLPQLYQGLQQRAATDPGFPAVVDAATLTVLRAKERAGLLGP